ncbi:crossover junction endodeoxyribonuclease RuvC [Microbacterium sp. MMO-113]|uniref:crossover junction endodeoxyribonuclease RuvC n=1 Tax=Microbacterium sp. MMO-113 TaxID=3081273 RepID=UPI0030171919
MSRFIGIDYSTTSTGVAIVDGEHWQVFRLRSSSTPGASLLDYYDRILGLSRDITAAIDFQPGDRIGIEGIAFAGRGSSVDRLHYAWHRTVEYVARTATEPVIVTTNQVKQLATGKGSADKDQVLLATERRIPQARVGGNDEADAAWVAVGVSILAGSPVIDLPAAHLPKAWTKGKTA